MLPDGAALAAWLQESCARTDLVCRHAACPTGDTTCTALSDPASPALPNPVKIWASTLSAGTWSAPQPLAVGQGDVTSPGATLASAGNGVVVFVQSDDRHKALWAARVAGGSFTATQRLDDVDGNVLAASTAADSAGRLTVAWSQFRTGRVRVAARRFQGGGWSAATLVDTGAGTGNVDGQPRVAARDGAALVAWSQGTATGRNRLFAARHDGGGWLAPVAVDEGAGLGNADSPVVGLATATQGVVAFRQRTGSGSGLMGLYATRLQAGAFTAPERMDVGTGVDDALTPALAVDPVSGSALVAWAQRDTERQKIRARRLVGDAWGLPATLDARLTGGDAFSPSVALRSGGNGIAAWYAYDATARGYRIKASSLVDGVWTDAIDVGPASGVPLVGTTDSGDNIALWFFNDGTRDRIGAAPDDRTPPSIELDPITTLSGVETPVRARLLADALSGLERVEWTFGDGPDTSDLVAPAHTWTMSGGYSVAVRAWDRAGNVATARTTATVEDGTPPVVDAGPDVSVFAGREVVFQGTATDDDSGVDIASVRWQIDGSAQTTGGFELRTTFPGEGTYVVRLEARDRAGNLGVDTVTVTSRIRPDDDVPPRVDAGPDLTVPLGAPLRLSGTVVDGESGIDEATVQWVIDDGAVYTGSEATHRFTSRGDHVARLKAADMAGNAAEDALIVRVGPDTAPPEIDAGADRVVEVGTQVELVGTARDDGSGVAPDSVHWVLPGGVERPGLRTTLTADAVGRLVIELHAADTLGNEGSDVVVVLVTPVGGDHAPPTVEAGPDIQAWVGVDVALSGTASDPGGVEVDPASARWVEDGVDLGSGLAIALRFPSPGQHTVSLRVADWLGNVGVDSRTVQVNVDAEAPTVSAGADVRIAPGAPITLAGTAVDGGSGLDPASVRWTFDDGSSATGLRTTRTFATAGKRTATLEARDRAGNRATDTLLVTVAAGTTGGSGGLGPRISTAARVAAFVGDRLRLRASTRRGSAPVTGVRWRFSDGVVRDGAAISRPLGRAGAITASVVATDSARRTARASVRIDVTRLRVRIVRAYRRKGRLYVRLVLNGPGRLTVRVGQGRAARSAKGIRIARARTIDVRLPKRARRRGTIRVAATFVRPQGARATAKRLVRVAPRR